MFNQVTFEDVFGVEFGVQKKVIAYPDKEANQFDILLHTPNHSEDSVQFMFTTMEWVFFRNILRMELWDGDQLLYTNNGKPGFNFFVNQSGVDPWKDDPTGHPKIAREPRTTWLEPDHRYILRVYRVKPDGTPMGPNPKNPINIQYTGTDGTEVEYEVTTPASEPAPVPIGDAVEMVFNGVRFICTPVQE